MRYWKERFIRVWRSDTKAVEALLTLSAAAWSVTLLRAGETFDNSVAFTTMRTLAPEEVWALAAGAIALLAPLALIFRLYQLRRWTLAVHAGWWAFVSTQLLLGDFLAPGGLGLWALRALRAVGRVAAGAASWAVVVRCVGERERRR